jgi:glycosyltransferase involved in cell wall biosynthesis
MKRLKAILRGAAEAVLLLTVVPVAVAVVAAAVMLSDLFAGRRNENGGEADEPVSRDAVSVVIPTWNGRDHLERNLSSVVEALAANPAHEIIVVDNASDDGTAEFLRDEFPGVRVLACDTNLGFGEGSNAGFRAARNDIVVLLNNDMRVDAGFLEPLLDGFRDPRVFAVTAQIFFSDPNKRREETGLVHGQWLNGRQPGNHDLRRAIVRRLAIFLGRRLDECVRPRRRSGPQVDGFRTRRSCEQSQPGMGSRRHAGNVTLAGRCRHRSCRCG